MLEFVKKRPTVVHEFLYFIWECGDERQCRSELGCWHVFSRNHAGCSCIHLLEIITTHRRTLYMLLF